MAGVEEKLGREVYISDESEGIIPRGFRYLWEAMIKREETFYVKASFMEIYNEQVRDILNPSSGILHTRWNVKNGFFVEDLMVVECANVDDLVAVLHEGMKNRRTGSHELNKDSSRSHSILTVYIISEQEQQGQMVRKYGKVSFVDLAGSERLKESKSHGDMVKETGNINRSLFVLGKVISGLSDRKNKQPYIPYRDSKLTMLLMDSLGGTSLALMIACISPSYVYIEETLSTLNYATRTMNIKNRPVVQMDPKEQIIFNLNRENELLRMENAYLREQLSRVTNGLPIEIPDFLQQGTRGGKMKELPPLSSHGKNASSSKKLIPGEEGGGEYQLELPVNKIMSEYQYEVNRLKKENEELRFARDVAEKNYHILMNDNNALQIRLENLENVFIGNPIQKGEMDNKQKNRIEDEFMITNVKVARFFNLLAYDGKHRVEKENKRSRGEECSISWNS
jgi:kinesin family protein 12